MATKNVLVIGDLHEPFCLNSYLTFNQFLYRKYDCNRVVFIGDIVDGHSWSYHEHDPNGKSAGDELNSTIKRLKRWYSAFPEADVLFGNHDLLIARKAKTIGFPREFIRNFKDVIEAPKSWHFHTDLIINKINYTHGAKGSAIDRARDSRMSTVQGHFHSRAFVEWLVSEKDRIFGMQVGCGIDRKAYAFSYGKEFVKKPIIGSGLILENGRLPIVELMVL